MGDLNKYQGHSDSLIASKDYHGHFCTFCPSDNKENADEFCIDCNRYLCKTCSEAHWTSSSRPKHRLLYNSQMPQRRSLSKDDDILIEKCEKHRQYIIDFYCTDCDRVGCKQCMEDNHKSCATVYIPDYDKDENKHPKHLKIFSFYSLKSSISKTPIEEEIEKVENYKWMTKMHSQNAHEQVKAKHRELSNVLDRIESNTHMMVDEKADRTLEKLDEYAQQLKLAQRKQDQFASNIRTSHSPPNNHLNKAFVNRKLSSESAQIFDTKKQEMSTELNDLTKFCFQTDRTLETQFRDITFLGSIGKMPERNGRMHLKIKHSLSTTSCFKKYYPGFSEQSKTMVDVCIIFSNGKLLLRSHICNVASTLLFLCDIQAKPECDNYSADFKVLAKIDTCNYFLAMTNVDDTRVLIALTDIKKVQFLHIVNDTLQLGKHIDVSDECTANGCLEDKLFVYSEKTNKIEILDLEGNFLKTVSFLSSEFHEDFHLKGYVSIACDPIRKRVYVVDQFNDCIIVLNKQGRPTAVVWNNPDFYNTNMKEPMKACIGGEGEIYVAVNYPYSIQKISHDLLERNYLAVKGLTWDICSIACHDNKLYFGNRGGDFYIAEVSNDYW